mgnify:FL=1
MSDDIKKALCVLIAAQYNKLDFIHKTGARAPNDSLDGLWQPQDLYIQLKDQMIDDLRSGKTSKPDFLQVKTDVMNAVDSYKELYSIYKKLKF